MHPHSWITFGLAPAPQSAKSIGSEMNPTPVMVLLLFITLLAVCQRALWMQGLQVCLHRSRFGLAVMQALPWRPRSTMCNEYGRSTARRPFLALWSAATLCLLAGSGVIVWRHVTLEVAYEPLAYLDGQKSALAQRAAHTRAAFGAPPNALSVLASACAGHSVLDASLLHPLISMHNAIVEARAVQSRSYADVCRHHFEPPASSVTTASTRGSVCAVHSILALANPQATRADGRIDSATHLWVPVAEPPVTEATSMKASGSSNCVLLSQRACSFDQAICC